MVTLREWTRRIASRPLMSGLPTVTWRSKRPGPEQRGIENVLAVGGGDDDDAALGFEAVHLDEELVECLLALFMAQRTATAAAAHGVQLVDEDDAGLVAAGFLEQAAHAGGADTGIHLDEVRAAREEKRNARLAGNRPGEESLTGSGRPDQQHALGNAAAE